MSDRVVVSARDLEQVKLLVFQINTLIADLKTSETRYNSPADVGRHLEAIVNRFVATRLEDDRMEAE